MILKLINKEQYTIKNEVQMALWSLCSTLNLWIGEFMVSFFDVTNMLYDYQKIPLEILSM